MIITKASVYGRFHRRHTDFAYILPRVNRLRNFFPNFQSKKAKTSLNEFIIVINLFKERTIMKKVLSALLAVSMALTFCASCSVQGNDDVKLQGGNSLSVTGSGDAKSVFKGIDNVLEAYYGVPETVTGVAIKPSVEITETMEYSEKLSAVALIVKTELGISDKYTKFSGDYISSGTIPYWSLNWSNDEETLSVSADEDGTIYNYYLGGSTQGKDVYYYRYGYNSFFSPVLQKTEKAQAMKAAKEFLSLVLKTNEGTEISASAEQLQPYETSSYSFSSILSVNGIKTPITLYVSVDSETMKVTSYSRSDLYGSYVGGFPAVENNTSATSAKSLLTATLKLDLRYILEQDETGKSVAKLEYIPLSVDGNYAVYAKDGKLFDINDLYDSSLGKDYNDGRNTSTEETVGAADIENPTVADAGSKVTLSDVELEGIKNLEGVLTAAQLDAVLKGIPEIGLGKFTQTDASYSLNKETNDVYVNVSYSYKVQNGAEIGMTEAGFNETDGKSSAYYITKYFYMNARTGDIYSFSTSYPYFSSEYKSDALGLVNTLGFAKDFLTKYHADEFAKTVVNENEDGGDKPVYPIYSSYSYYWNGSSNAPTTSYSFVEEENGYKLYTNNINVTVNNHTGTIDSYNMNWTYDVTFETPDGIISADDAMKIYGDSFDCELSYLSLPFAVKADSTYEIYYSMGYAYVYNMTPCYTINNNKNVYAVVAKTGELLTNEYDYTFEPIQYTDIGSSQYENLITELSLYGIGFGESTEFRPSATLCQKDALVFLLSATGYSFDCGSLTTEDDINSLYNSAYSAGFLTSDEKDPNKTLVKSDIVKMIVAASEYGSAAKLNGIFKSSYSDAAKIPDGVYSYMAIAEGLNMIDTDAQGACNATAAALREDIAAILYAFMSR